MPTCKKFQQHERRSRNLSTGFGTRLFQDCFISLSSVKCFIAADKLFVISYYRSKGGKYCRWPYKALNRLERCCINAYPATINGRTKTPASQRAFSESFQDAFLPNQTISHMCLSTCIFYIVGTIKFS
jgi:hypothetical protein